MKTYSTVVGLLFIREQNGISDVDLLNILLKEMGEMMERPSLVANAVDFYRYFFGTYVMTGIRLDLLGVKKCTSHLRHSIRAFAGC